MMRGGFYEKWLYGLACLMWASCSIQGSDEPAGSSSSGTGSSSSVAIQREMIVRDSVTHMTDRATRYIINQGLTIEHDLTIGPGVEVECRVGGKLFMENGVLRVLNGSVLKMAKDCYIEVKNGARISVEGDVGDSVRFVSLRGDFWGYDGNSANYSGGIWIASTAAANNAIAYAVLEKALVAVYAARAGGLSITHSRVAATKYHGLFINEGALDTADRVRFESIGGYDLRIEPSDVARVGDSLTWWSGILLSGNGAASESGRWPKARYQVEEPVVIGGAEGFTTEITLSPGSEFYFAENAYIEISDRGRLLAVGTAADSIYFRPASGLGKHWGYGEGDYSGGIWVDHEAAARSRLAFVVVDSAKIGVYSRQENGIEITHSRFNRARSYGVYAEAPGLALLDSCAFSGSGIADISVEPLDVGRLGASLNLGKSVLVRGGTADLSADWPALSYLIIDPVILGDAPTTTEIRIAPGAELRFNADAYLELRARARLIAQGTAAKKIRFSPAESGKFWGYDGGANYSGGIWINNDAAAGTSLKYVIVDSARVALFNEDAVAVSVDNSVISDYQYWGIYDPEGAVTVTASTISSAVPSALGQHYRE